MTLFCGVPLLRTRMPEETVHTMLFAARQGRTFVTGALPRRGRRPRGKRARQLYILQSFPGIGPDRAHRLLERFGSVEAIIRAGVEDLRAVSGIGERIAGTLRWSVEEPRRNYRFTEQVLKLSQASGQPSDGNVSVSYDLLVNEV